MDGLGCSFWECGFLIEDISVPIELKQYRNKDLRFKSFSINPERCTYSQFNIIDLIVLKICIQLICGNMRIKLKTNLHCNSHLARDVGDI